MNTDKAKLKLGTKYETRYGEVYGLCAKCDRRIIRLARSLDYQWVHDVTRNPSCASAHNMAVS